MQNPNQLHRLALAGFTAMALLVGGVACGSEAATTPERTTTTMDANAGAEAAADTFAQNFRNDVLTHFVGFQEGDIVAGADVDFSQNPQERGSAAFSDHTLTSGEDIASFLNNSEDPRSAAMKHKLEEDLKDQPEALAHALKGENYVPVQTLVDINITGNGYFVKGEVKYSKHQRYAAAGDVFWLLTNDDGHVIWSGFVRADCGNGGVTEVTPAVPGTPSVKVELPPGHETPTTVPPARPGFPKKVPVPLVGTMAHPQPGAGGAPENGMDPQKDSRETGYGPGDEPTATLAPTPEAPTTTAPAGTETGPVRPEGPSTPATTVVTVPQTPPPPLGN